MVGDEQTCDDEREQSGPVKPDLHSQIPIEVVVVVVVVVGVDCNDDITIPGIGVTPLPLLSASHTSVLALSHCSHQWVTEPSSGADVGG